MQSAILNGSDELVTGASEGKEQSQMWRCFVKGRPFSGGVCTLSLLLVVSGLASCGANSSKGELPPPPPPSQAPMIILLSPSCAPAGEPVQLGVVGNNFLSSSVVRWNGSDRPTTMDAINGLVAQISASDVANAGTAEVTGFDPGSGGGTSKASSLSHPQQYGTH